MKKRLLLIFLILGLMLALTACGGGDSTTTEGTDVSDTVNLSAEDFQKLAKKEMTASIKYYKDVVLEEIPKLSKEVTKEPNNIEKQNAVKVKLQEAIDKLRSDEKKYLVYSADDRLTEDAQQAADLLYDGFMEARIKALQPILVVIKGESNDMPEYSKIVPDVEERYIDPAKGLL